ncbi:MAG: 2-phospho-L-lactate transferase [Acidimicrobiales bacterium]
MITALAGGVGAARFLRGLAAVVDPAGVCAVVNTGDDEVFHGLHVSPDLDTVTYTLAGAVNPDTGWGLAGETWAAMEALGRYGGQTWFRLGDRDLATHLYRTQRMAEGGLLSAVAAEVGMAWKVPTRLLPMSDDPVRTRLTLPGGEEVSFQDYFVRQRHAVAVAGVRFAGAESAAPGPGVLEAIASADPLVICPSNPIVSIGPILAVASVRAAVSARRERAVAISPIVAGAAIRGPADRLMAELGHEPSVVGVARLYAPLAATLVVDEADAGLAEAVEAEGMACLVAPTVMATPARAAALARLVVTAGAVPASGSPTGP